MMSAKRIGIVEIPGSFSDRWIEYCSQNNILVQLINPFSTHLIDETKGMNGFLWNWNLDDFTASLFARQLIASLSLYGIKTYPNIKTCWHYDDKVAQKYLLDTISAPLAPTWIFYSLGEALDWISATTFPKVFKLRRGAGSANVKIVKTANEARQLCKVAFSSGFNPIPAYTNDLRNKFRQTQKQKTLFEKFIRAPSVIKSLIRGRKYFPLERGYIYFQEYMADNLYDTRITIIGERGFGFIRRNRPGDFRASGSGLIDSTLENIDQQLLPIAFDIAQKIEAQSLAMDFVYNLHKRPTLLEISYTFAPSAVYQCPGYWDSSLNWHCGHVWPQDAIIEDLLEQGKAG